MGKGIDAARTDAPEHAELMDNLKEQLLLVFLKRLGGKVSIPVKEIDDTGQDMLYLRVDENKVFHFVMGKKQ